MVLSICGKENTMKQNNPCYLFGMYKPDTDSVIVNAIYDTYIGWHREILSCMLNQLVNLMDYRIMWKLWMNLINIRLDIFNPQA